MGVASETIVSFVRRFTRTMYATMYAGGLRTLCRPAKYATCLVGRRSSVG